MNAYGICEREKRPVIVCHPGRMGGNPTIGHSRLPVDAVASTYWHYGFDEVLAMWDYLTEDDVMVCCWYQARHGTRTWRQRWKEWLTDNEAALWGPNTYGKAELPPTVDQGDE